MENNTNESEMKTEDFKCPLCGSLLARDRWVRITGRWEELEKEKNKTKKLLEQTKKEKLEIEKSHKADMKKLSKQAEALGIAKGIKKEKSERERMNKMLSKKAKDLEASNKKIQELQKQLKQGKTPQIAGFDYEKEVQRMLSETFPEDKIQSTGKKGDVIQFVTSNEVEVGSILYECKKTEKYSNQFVKEIRRHQEVAKSDYAVIVTHAPKEGKSRFFIEENVIVIDPLGLLDIAILLRDSIIDINKMKLTKKEAKEKGIQILRYMQTGEFSSNMTDTIDKSRKAYELLVREVKNHQNEWIERIKIYSSIHNNIQDVRQSIGEIVTGGPVQLETYEFTQFQSNQIPKLGAGDDKK